MSRVAIFARVSTGKIEQEHGLVAQIAACRRFIADRLPGAVEAGVYEEQVSGRKEERKREALSRLLQDAAMRRFQAVVVFRFDRLSRRQLLVTGDVVDVLKRLGASGVWVYSASETWWDPDNPTAPLILAALTWAAAMESQAIGDRVRSGIAARRAEAAAKGEPFLWGRARSPTSKLIADPTLPPRAAALRRQGASWREIGAALGVGRTTAKRLYLISQAGNGTEPREPGDADGRPPQ